METKKVVCSKIGCKVIAHAKKVKWSKVSKSIDLNTLVKVPTDLGKSVLV